MEMTAAKRLRIERKVNLATLARRTGIPREIIESFEDGDKKGQLTFTQICAIAYVLKVSVKEICSVDVDSFWVEDPNTDIPEEIAEREKATDLNGSVEWDTTSFKPEQTTKERIAKNQAAHQKEQKTGTSSNNEQVKVPRLTEKEQRLQIGKLVQKRITELGISPTAVRNAGINNVHLILYTQGSPEIQEQYKEKVAKLIGVDISVLEVKK